MLTLLTTIVLVGGVLILLAMQPTLRAWVLSKLGVAGPALDGLLTFISDIISKYLPKPPTT